MQNFSENPTSILSSIEEGIILAERKLLPYQSIIQQQIENDNLSTEEQLIGLLKSILIN